jgi:hypothetical protein
VRRPRASGQAALELLAVVPLLVLAVLLAWQLAAVIGAGLRAEERVRRDALGTTGAPGRLTTVGATVAVPALLPGADGLAIRARAVVRAP